MPDWIGDQMAESDPKRRGCLRPECANSGHPQTARRTVNLIQYPRSQRCLRAQLSVGPELRLNEIAAARQHCAHRQLADLEDAARAAADARRYAA
jgi:hypothetical protein